MNETIKIPYSKTFCYLSMTFIGFLIIGSLTHFYGLSKNGPTDWTGIALMDFVLLVFIFFIIYKYYIPALKGNPALEFTPEEVIDHIRHRKMSWDNVAVIRLTSGQSDDVLVVDLIDNNLYLPAKNNLLYKFLSKVGISFYGSPFIMRTQYIKGKSKDFYKIAFDYCQMIKSTTLTN